MCNMKRCGICDVELSVQYVRCSVLTCVTSRCVICGIMWLWCDGHKCSGAMWQSVWCSNIVNIPHPILHWATSWTTPHHAPFHITKAHDTPHPIQCWATSWTIPHSAPFQITKAHDTPHLACCSFHPAPHHIPLHAPFHMTWHHISLHQWCGSTCPFHITKCMTPHLAWCAVCGGAILGSMVCTMLHEEMWNVVQLDVELCCCDVMWQSMVR